MDKSREDKCEWMTCGTIYLMRNILREKVSLAMVLKVGKLALTNDEEWYPSQKKKVPRAPQMGLAERHVGGYNIHFLMGLKISSWGVKS